MAILAQDSFNRTSASAWGTSDSGAVWVPNGSGLVSSTVAGSYAKMTGSTGTCYEQLPIAHGDIEIVGRFLFSAINSSSWGGFCVRYTDTNNFYHSRISGAGNLSISRRMAGSGVDIVTYSFTPVVATWYWIRFRVWGSTLQSKYWINGSPEPSGWRLQTTDTNFTSGTYIALRHNMSTAATYTWWQDMMAVDYGDVYSNLETVNTDQGLTEEVTTTEDNPLAQNTSTTSEKAVEHPYTLQGSYTRGGISTPSDMALVALASGDALQQTAAITESIGNNFEVVDAQAGRITLEKIFSSTDILLHTYAESTTVTNTENYAVADSTNRSVERADTGGGGEVLVNSTSMVSTTNTSVGSIPVTDSMTQERAISKNLFESTSLLPGNSRQTQTTEDNPAQINTGDREEDSVSIDLLALLADGLVALNGVFSNIAYNLEWLNATSGILGDRQDATSSQMLYDIPIGLGSRQLESVFLSLVGTQAQEKNFSLVLSNLFSDIAQQSKSISTTLYNTVVDAPNTTGEDYQTALLFFLDGFTGTSIKEVLHNELLQDTSLITRTVALLLQLSIYTDGATTKEAKDTVLELLRDAIGYRQETHYKDILALAMVVVSILGQETTQTSLSLVDDAGNVSMDYPAAMKKPIAWKTPRMDIRWETPSMVVRWETHSYRVYWSTSMVTNIQTDFSPIVQGDTPVLVNYFTQKATPDNPTGVFDLATVTSYHMMMRTYGTNILRECTGAWGVPNIQTGMCTFHLSSQDTASPGTYALYAYVMTAQGKRTFQEEILVIKMTP